MNTHLIIAYILLAIALIMLVFLLYLKTNFKPNDGKIILTIKQHTPSIVFIMIFTSIINIITFSLKAYESIDKHQYHSNLDLLFLVMWSIILVAYSILVSNKVYLTDNGIKTIYRYILWDDIEDINQNKNKLIINLKTGFLSNKSILHTSSSDAERIMEIQKEKSV